MMQRLAGPSRFSRSEGRVVMSWREGEETRRSHGYLVSIYPDEVHIVTDGPPPVFQIIRFRVESSAEPEWFQAFVTRRGQEPHIALVFHRRCFIRFYRTVAGHRKTREMVRSLVS